MEVVKGRRGLGDKSLSIGRMVQEIFPPAGWTEDSASHSLLIDLPDFRKDEVKLEADESGRVITVSGERLVNNNNKYIYFEKTFKAPQDSDIERITGKFVGDILYVTIPKKPPQPQMQNKEPTNETIKNDQDVAKHAVEEQKERPSDLEETENNEEESRKDSCEDGFQKESRKDRGEDGIQEKVIEKRQRSEFSLLQKATRMLCKNREILLIATALAFSLGMFVSRNKG